MNFKSWKDILNEYTKIFENCRYDHITKDAYTYIADILNVTNTMNNNYYASFGTYRHDITADTSIVKIYETGLKEKEILDNFYEINPIINNDTNETINYIFPGIVLNKDFAVNGNELSLEDLFAEYGYDYLKAVDASLIAHNQEPKYFQQTKTENGETIQGGYYEILPIDSSFTEKNNKGEDVTINVKYDGTYVPTVNEILSGELYIIIKSGDMPEQKIYFNNKFLPTLFINDDKYPNNTELYLLENQQTLKLCDLCMFQKLGCQIIWDEKLIILENIKYIKSEIFKQIIETSGLENYDQSNILFEFNFQVKVKLNTESQWHYIITHYRNIKLPAETLSTNKSIDLDNNTDFSSDGSDIINGNNTDDNYNYLLSPFKNDNATGKLTMGQGSGQEIPNLLLEFTMGVSLILKGFSANYTSRENSYLLSWYEYIEDDNTNYELYINITNTNNIKINNLSPDAESNIQLELNNNKIPASYTINMNLTDIIENSIVFQFYAKIQGDDTLYQLNPTDTISYTIKSEYNDIYKISNQIINNSMFIKIEKLNYTPTTDINEQNIQLGNFSNETLGKNINILMNFYNTIT